MAKDFYPRSRFAPFYFIIFVLFLVVVISWGLGEYIKQGWQNLLYTILYVLIYLSPILLYGIYKATYKLSVSSDGIIEEKQLLRRTRLLDIKDINQISLGWFIEIFIFPFWPLLIIRGARLENLKYSRFPRYVMPDSLIEHIKQFNSSITVSKEYNISSIDQKGSKSILFLAVFAFILSVFGSAFYFYQKIPKSISDCESLAKRGVNSDQCYFKLSRYNDDPVICSKIFSKSIRYSCYGNLAKQKQDESICRMAPTIYEQENCLAMVASGLKDVSWCEKISTQNTRETCYKEVAIGSNNLEICDKITSKIYSDDVKDFCYYEVATRNINLLACDQIKVIMSGGKPLREQCIEEVQQLKNQYEK